MFVDEDMQRDMQTTMLKVNDRLQAIEVLIIFL